MPALSQGVYVLGNPQKPEVAAVFQDFCRFVAEHSRLAGAELSTDGRPAVTAGAQRAIVLGGDGTLLAVGRSLGAQQIPLLGVNFGKLGYIAEFLLDELKAQFDRVISDDSLVAERMTLEASTRRGGRATFSSLAINDCVIQAGPPYRMIELAVSVSGTHLTDILGDGLVVCTPLGSTAHNLSAGGPIVQSGVEAIVLTPLTPHSLTHRPVVVEAEHEIEITAKRVNSGTTAIIDGQVLCPLAVGDRVRLRRSATRLKVVRNPQYPPWHKLVSKLRWGQAPTYA
ncbi:MAG TPA: NAD(+)/NADH kinase [Phycisphaerae bacterium]|jgi:NAD+ kinase